MGLAIPHVSGLGGGPACRRRGENAALLRLKWYARAAHPHGWLPAQIDARRHELTRSVLPKSPLGDALRYLGNQWVALQRFVDDGRVAIDNNRAEGQLRVVAVGRNNWLFAGSLEGAHRAALLYSLVQSCKLVDVHPFDYVKDVLLRVATHPQALIHDLTPKGWATTFGSRASA